MNRETHRVEQQRNCFGLRWEAERHAALEFLPQPKAVSPLRFAATLQDASDNRVLLDYREVLDCASPLALWHRLRASFPVLLCDPKTGAALCESWLGARTAMSARTTTLKLADKAVRAPVTNREQDVVTPGRR